MYACPCCGFKGFIDAPGSYDKCPVCECEEDEVQFRFPEYRRGANHHPLCEYQSRTRAPLPDEVEVCKGYIGSSRTQVGGG